MQNKKASKILLTLGIVFVVAGVIFASIGVVGIVRFAGDSINDTMGWGESKVENTTATAMRNNAFTFAGAVLILVGYILIRIYKRIKLFNGEYHVLSESQKQMFNELSNKTPQKEDTIICEYCGSIVDPKTLKCSSCGAKHKKNKD